MRSTSPILQLLTAELDQVSISLYIVGTGGLAGSALAIASMRIAAILRMAGREGADLGPCIACCRIKR